MGNKSKKYFDDIPDILKEVFLEKFRELFEDGMKQKRYVKLRLPDEEPNLN